MAWDYISIQCDADDIQATLKKHGADGWRLHTCEPYVIIGNQGIGVVHFVVVMDRAVVEPPKPVERAEDGAPIIKREPISGLRMKG